MSRARAAWTVAVIDIIVFAIAVAITPSDLSVVATVGANLLYVAGIASFTAAGALLITRVPAHLSGPLLLASGTLLTVAVVIGAYGAVGLAQEPPWPAAGSAATIGDALFIYPIVIALIGIPLYFPDGRLPSRRFRWVVRITIADMAVWTVEALRNVRGSGPASGIPGGDFVSAILVALEPFILVATVVSFGAAVVAVGIRFRRGGSVQRQQVKWLLAVVAFGAVVWPASFLLDGTDLGNVLSVVGTLAVFALPVVIGIAVLRYRLYDIDRIISRVIGYAVVTGVLAVVFVAAVLALQAVLAPVLGDNPVGVAASTLIVAALFQPLRVGVQRIVDRRFNRARYDAQRTADSFAGRLRDQVDLATVAGDLRATVAASLGPSHVGVWLREGEAG